MVTPNSSVGVAAIATEGSLDSLVLRDPTDVDMTLKKAAIISILTTSNVLMLLGNGFSIYIILSSRCLRRYTYYWLVLNLAIVDLMNASVVVPLNIVWEFYGNWPFSQLLCDVEIFFDLSFSTLAAHSIVLLSLDKYLYITKPFFYHTYIDSKTTLGSILATWVIWVTYSAVSVFGEMARSTMDDKYDFPMDDCNFVLKHAYAIISFILVFFIPLVILVFTSSRILCVARKHIMKIKNNHRVSDATVSSFDLTVNPNTTGEILSRPSVPDTSADVKRRSGENETSADVHGSTRQNEISANILRSLRQNDTSVNVQRSEKQNKTSTDVQGSPRQNETSANVLRSLRQNDTSVNVQRSEKQNKTSTDVQRNPRQNETSAGIQRSPRQNETSTHIQRSLRQNEISTDVPRRPGQSVTSVNIRDRSVNKEYKTVVNKTHLKVIVTPVPSISTPTSTDNEDCFSASSKHGHHQSKTKATATSRTFRAFGTVTLVVFAYIVMFAPYWIASVINLDCLCVEPMIFEDYLAVFYYMHSLVNPFIFMATDRRYKKAISHLMKKLKLCHICKRRPRVTPEIQISSPYL